MVPDNKGQGFTWEASPIQNIYGPNALANVASRATEESCQTFPSFLVAGPPRTGTSWLHEILRGHVNLPHPTKETRFFDVHFHRGIKWYLAHFPISCAGRPTGEIAPTYFASEQARERIAQTIPGGKLVFVFRNPVERVISLYRVKRAYGMFPWSLEQALDLDGELITSGRYSTALNEWQRLFAKEQILITIYDDLQKDPQAFVDRLADFIGIPRIALSKTQLKRSHSSEAMTQPRNYIATRTATSVADWLKARRLDHMVDAVRRSSLFRLFVGGGKPFSDVPPELLRRLSEIFRPEVDGLEMILGRDLSSWKTARPDTGDFDQSIAQKFCNTTIQTE